MTPVRSAISRSACAFGGSIAGRLLLSLLLLRRSGNRHWSILRSAQVAGNLVFVHRPGHEFIQHVLAFGVELYGLALVLSFFSMVLSSAVTFSVYLPRLGSVFLSCKAT